VGVSDLTEQATEQKSGAFLWLTLALVAALLLFPVSFGPAVWGATRGYLDRRSVEKIYRPIFWAGVHGPEPVKAGIHWWGGLGIVPGKAVLFLVPSPDGGWNFVRFGTDLGL